MTEHPDKKHMRELGLTIPESIVTFRVAEEGDRQMWVAEEPEMVLRLAAHGDQMITLTRVRGMESSPFSTRASNIMNVEAYR